ncbi:hypothetical protein ACLKA6_016777 [Drosophila palustris]
MWMYKGSLALIAGTNQRISKTDERQRVQSTESLSAASDISDYLVNEKATLFCNQNKEIWRRKYQKCLITLAHLVLVLACLRGII